MSLDYIDRNLLHFTIFFSCVCFNAVIIAWGPQKIKKSFLNFLLLGSVALFNGTKDSI